MAQDRTSNLDETDWSPERKVVGAAVAVVFLTLLQLVVSVEFPVGLEGAMAVIVAYFLPNKK